MTRLLRACLALGGLWLAGFVWFVQDASSPPVTATVCDGIVALTGGEQRVDTAITLLRGGYGHLLLISGVGPHVTLQHILHLQQEPLSSPLAARITLGRRATSTIGNAHETAEWAMDNRLHRLLVVTSGYHIRRAVLEIHRTAPDLDLIAYPVVPLALQGVPSRRTLFLMFREYNKLLGAEIGVLTGLPDGREGLDGA
ncbi:YdcF family protein [Gluconobacter kondonii]|uniref:YdcF family protein n=1 Tax=Gluconobacter kondonii TaxID=941463 RepID=UPI00198153C4|nr:YdcF family protein [Gluconobacter kondonii]MBN3867337.1 YdcF family protein [Gluconobacter kondonii]MBS1053013.1 YdcF family protein [Gluconobacter kondonii]MBS1056777.1 YdcF family protein [Gluconobacter kondonii]